MRGNGKTKRGDGQRWVDFRLGGALDWGGADHNKYPQFRSTESINYSSRGD